jgi:hypothetical protein
VRDIAAWIDYAQQLGFERPMPKSRLR